MTFVSTWRAAAALVYTHRFFLELLPLPEKIKTQVFVFPASEEAVARLQWVTIYSIKGALCSRAAFGIEASAAPSRRATSCLSRRRVLQL
jgi:hypothetical protein